MEINLIIRNSK